MIVVFANRGELEAWLKQCSTQRYQVYITQQYEIIVRPTKSSRNLDTGYLQEKSKEATEIAKEKIEAEGFYVQLCLTVHFNEMPPYKQVEVKS